MTTWYLWDHGDQGQTVVKVTDGVTSFVPMDEANSDWQAYQEWLAEGNTPEPWPPAE